MHKACCCSHQNSHTKRLSWVGYNKHQCVRVSCPHTVLECTGNNAGSCLTLCRSYLQESPPRCGFCDPGPDGVGNNSNLHSCEGHQHDTGHQSHLVAATACAQADKGQSLYMRNHLYGSCHQPCEVNTPKPAVKQVANDWISNHSNASSYV